METMRRIKGYTYDADSDAYALTDTYGPQTTVQPTTWTQTTTTTVRTRTTTTVRTVRENVAIETTTERGRDDDDRSSSVAW